MTYSSQKKIMDNTLVLQGNRSLVLDPKEKEKTAKLIRQLIENIGENPNRECLLKTPERVVESLRFLTRGYSENPDEVINDAVFHERHDEMIVLKDIVLYSLCEHHMLPFIGRAHVAYLPKDKIIGLSKIARLVDIFARRLQVQERLTQEIADTLHKALNPLGVGVIVEAEHLCMQMRGVQKRGSVMITSAMLGAFRDRPATREEFMSFVRHN